MLWHITLMPPESRRLRQEVHELKATLSYVVRPCLKRQEREKEKEKKIRFFNRTMAVERTEAVHQPNT